MMFCPWLESQQILMSLFSPIFCVIRAGIECNKIDNFPDLFVLVSRASGWCSCELHKEKKNSNKTRKRWRDVRSAGSIATSVEHCRRSCTTNTSEPNLRPIASVKKAREKTQHRRRAQRVCGLMSMVPKVLMFRYISLIFYGERVEAMVTLPRSMKCFLGGSGRDWKWRETRYSSPAGAVSF